jgi:hypothetical protein
MFLVCVLMYIQIKMKLVPVNLLKLPVTVLTQMDVNCAQLWFNKALVSELCSDSHEIPIVLDSGKYT